MQDILGESLRKLRKIRIRKTRMIAIALVLSFVVSLDVFWWMRQPGLTLAGDADCGVIEHTHDETCQSGEIPCGLIEHTHDISCYSDDASDVETQLDWQKMFADYPYTGDLRKDLVGIALMQVGYTESTENFQVGSDGIRRGYTRYGAWYGAPYNDWSAIFVSFCLHFAGADPEETPGNTGAASMAEIWNTLGKYAQASEYIPVAGDLVFFTDNTAGIVTEVYNATCYVIRGDQDNAVQGELLSLTDPSIAGWGLTVGTVYRNKDPSQEELLDISNGPAVFIFEGAEAPAPPPMRRFSLRAARTVIDLIEYLEDVKGSYFFTLLDRNNQELPKDTSGNYVAQVNTLYKLTISFTSHGGFHPGTYQYQIPNGLRVDGGQGSFVLQDGTHVGEWTVTNDGLITLDFNEQMDNHSDITISITLGVWFPDQDDSVDFDGKISVSVQKPPEEKEHTKLNKWGSAGQEAKKQDPSKIYWTVEIQGKKDSQIPGGTITDQIKLGDHHFTQSDIDGGLHFGVGVYDLQTGEQTAWHAWDVMPGDPNLTWTETGWTYDIPESVMCKWCPTPIELGNDGWIYYIEYTSTPEPANIAGTIWYTNEVIIDGQYMEGWGSFEHAQVQASIIKDGSFHSDANHGKFLWEFQATVPGRVAGEKAVYLWQIMDNLRIKHEVDGVIGYVKNDANQATVTVVHNGQTVTVPNVADVTATDEFAWHNLWSSDHGDGIYYGRALVLLNRCHCTEESCQFWTHGSCGSQYWYEAANGYWYTNGMCYCWTEEESTTFTFSYSTEDISVIDKYGGQGNSLQNEVLLQNTVYSEDGIASTITVGTAKAEVPIPGVFNKELTRDYDGYVAHYRVTVNEGKLVLTNGTPLTIHDMMTPTLAYISGSLVISAEDANGNVTTLKQGVDYDVTYDGTGKATDDYGNPVHVLDIVIQRPQPVMYILDYDTTLLLPDQLTSGIKYSNAATISLWGKDIGDISPEKIYANINIATKSYKVKLYKTDSLTGEPLGGAAFGLFNAQGGLVASGTTNENGEQTFQTNVTQGVILRAHQLYYIQELRAPPGYQLDNAKQWICFCDEATDTCEQCAQIAAEKDAIRVLSGQLGGIHLKNTLLSYDLPQTGGPGIYPLMLASVVFIITPLVYSSILRRKRERRGVP